MNFAVIFFLFVIGISILVAFFFVLFKNPDEPLQRHDWRKAVEGANAVPMYSFDADNKVVPLTVKEVMRPYMGHRVTAYTYMIVHADPPYSYMIGLVGHLSITPAQGSLYRTREEAIAHINETMSHRAASLQRQLDDFDQAISRSDSTLIPSFHGKYIALENVPNVQ